MPDMEIMCQCTREVLTKIELLQRTFECHIHHFQKLLNSFKNFTVLCTPHEKKSDAVYIFNS